MKINQSFQSLHQENGDARWVEVQLVERDICLLYHQLAEFSFIAGDLNYGSVFSLAYWNYLDVQLLKPEAREFLRQGCLVMLLAMCLDEIAGSSKYMGRLTAKVSTALDALSVDDSDTRRLMAIVRRAVTLVEAGAKPGGFLEEEARALETALLEPDVDWVHETFVQRYFRSRAKQFDENPYLQRTV